MALNAFPTSTRPEIPGAIQNAMDFRKSLGGRGASLGYRTLQLDVGAMRRFTTWSPGETFFTGDAFFTGESAPEPMPVSDIGTAEEVLRNIRLVSSADLEALKQSIARVRERVNQQATRMREAFQSWQTSGVHTSDALLNLQFQTVFLF